MTTESDDMSLAEAASIAGRVPDTVSQWLKDPDGPAYKVFRRRIRINRKSFLAWLDAQSKDPRA